MDFCFLQRKDVYLKIVEIGQATGVFPAEIILRNEKFTVGRSNLVDCCIRSQNISKLHASFKQSRTPTFVDGVASVQTSWTVTDCMSTNGVFVNGERLIAACEKKLSPKDVICFQSKNDEPNAIYIFLQNVPTKPAATTPLRPSSPFPSSSSSSSSSSQSSIAIRLLLSPTRPRDLHLKNRVAESANDDYSGIPVKKAKLQRDSGSSDWFGGDQSSLQCRALQLKNDALKEKLEQTKREFDENLRDQADAAAAKEVESTVQLRKLEQELGRAQKRLNEAESARSHSEEERTQLENEKSQLVKALLKKTKECRENEEKLQAVPASQSSSLTNLLRHILESECQCSICSEFFYKTTTLQCSHSYCAHCISEWQNKKQDCPICRQPISAFVPSLVVDAFIERVIEILPADVQAHRKEITEERIQLDATAKLAATAAAADFNPVVDVSVAGPSTRRGRRQTRQTTAVDNAAAFAQAAAAALATLPPQRDQGPAVADNVIELFSSQSTSADEGSIATDDYDDDDDDDMSDDYDYHDVMQGRDGNVYYGGYGHCYVCGDVGHWANGCPFR